jgi:hypothetical protein
MLRSLLVVLALNAAGALLAADPPAFIHPGMLHSAADLAFMKERVAKGEQPWAGAFELLQREGVSGMAWVPKPVAAVIRGPYNKPDIGSSAMMKDSAAAYSQALQWAITGDQAHAAKAIAILDAWSGVLASIDGPDRQLLAGITAYKFCNAAEILLHTPSGWDAQAATRLRTMLHGIYLPLIWDFKPAANGNWGAAMINSMLCIAVLSDDHPLFQRAVDFYLHGDGNGSIAHYVMPSGQCQESTRDQAHTQLGLGMLAAACETAWKQGVDLYGAEGNRLMAGIEYTAKYNLGFEVPCQGTISALYRGKFRPIYEKVYQHYAVDGHLAMPFTRQVIERNRPEGFSPDHESWGTLTALRVP